MGERSGAKRSTCGDAPHECGRTGGSSSHVLLLALSVPLMPSASAWSDGSPCSLLWMWATSSAAARSFDAWSTGWAPLCCRSEPARSTREMVDVRTRSPWTRWTRRMKMAIQLFTRRWLEGASRGLEGLDLTTAGCSHAATALLLIKQGADLGVGATLLPSACFATDVGCCAANAKGQRPSASRDCCMTG